MEGVFATILAKVEKDSYMLVGEARKGITLDSIMKMERVMLLGDEPPRGEGGGPSGLHSSLGDRKTY